MDQAMLQVQPVYKIRHLKAGLRLCVCLCQCDDDVTRYLLTQLPLCHMLYELYHLPHMALSIKLLILRFVTTINICFDIFYPSRRGIKSYAPCTHSFQAYFFAYSHGTAPHHLEQWGPGDPLPRRFIVMVTPSHPNSKRDKFSLWTMSGRSEKRHDSKSL